MSSRMTKTARVEDIANRCGYSIEVVNAVLKAEKESTIDSLKRGEKVTLPGRCLISPVMKTRPAYVNGQLTTENYLSATMRPLQSLLDCIEHVSEYEVKEAANELDSVRELMAKNKIAIVQIESLE